MGNPACLRKAPHQMVFPINGGLQTSNANSKIPQSHVPQPFLLERFWTQEALNHKSQDPQEDEVAHAP